jgi:DNA repair protein RecO (recombination protein O)
MLVKCRGIVIKTIDYSESSVILKCFTDAHGLQSYLINGVRKNKGQIRPSQLLPLTLLELEVYHQQNKNLQRIKELKCSPPLHQLHFSMVKSSIGMFLSEVLNRSIREEHQADNALFDFIYNAIQLLDIEQQKLSNFPIYFLVQLSRYLGFYPQYQNSGTGTMGFNQPLNCLLQRTFKWFFKYAKSRNFSRSFGVIISSIAVHIIESNR